jgi:hypothetical protein
LSAAVAFGSPLNGIYGEPPMTKITHKVFASAAIDMRILKPTIEIYEEIREMVQTYINEIGVDKVVSINESVETGRLTIVLWYRVDDGAAK